MNLSVSPKLRKQIQVDLNQLRALLNRHPALLARCAQETPSDVELDALAALLHAFYTGVENIFKRIALEQDGNLPKSAVWHADLLNSMAEPSAMRPAVITQDLRKTLRGYLDFRHVFRHAYTFELQWSKMVAQVLNLQQTFDLLEKQLFQIYPGSASEQTNPTTKEEASMPEFKNVSIIKKANVYFDGKVTSRTVLFADGTKKTLGIMMPGDYEFGTGDKEIMEMLGGEMDVLLPGEENWRTFKEGESYEVWKCSAARWMCCCPGKRTGARSKKASRMKCPPIPSSN
jgi:purine/pyrimidine-nucleoside phosphorylase